MKHILFTVTIALGLVACGHDGMSGPEGMQTMIDEVRAENRAHLDAVVGAPTMAAMGAEMTRHEDRMGDMMGEMGGMMEGMSRCMGMAGMHAMHDDMMGEMARHAATMGTAATRDAAVVEVRRHAGEMDMMLEGMHHAAGDMECDGRGHM